MVGPILYDAAAAALQPRRSHVVQPTSPQLASAIQRRVRSQWCSLSRAATGTGR